MQEYNTCFAVILKLQMNGNTSEHKKSKASTCSQLSQYLDLANFLCASSVYECYSIFNLLAQVNTSKTQWKPQKGASKVAKKKTRFCESTLFWENHY